MTTMMIILNTNLIIKLLVCKNNRYNIIMKVIRGTDK